MITLKKMALLSVIAFFCLSGVYAQIGDVNEATRVVKSNLVSQEINSLPDDPLLLRIPGDPRIERDSRNRVKVGKLLVNGDYGKYYKNKARIKLPRGFYVFIPKEVKEKCISKLIGDSRRFSRFLGLDDVADRDTIIYFWIDESNLFRPAYNSDITSLVPGSTSYRGINSADRRIQEWFSNEQRFNTYPWTRMGYTFDWGDANHIGATEFVNLPGIDVDYAGFETVPHFLP